MARRNWTKCKCGAKLRTKSNTTKCFKCQQQTKFTERYPQGKR